MCFICLWTTDASSFCAPPLSSAVLSTVARFSTISFVGNVCCAGIILRFIVARYCSEAVSFVENVLPVDDSALPSRLFSFTIHRDRDDTIRCHWVIKIRCSVFPWFPLLSLLLFAFRVFADVCTEPSAPPPALTAHSSQIQHQILALGIYSFLNCFYRSAPLSSAHHEKSRRPPQHAQVSLRSACCSRGLRLPLPVVVERYVHPWR